MPVPLVTTTAVGLVIGVPETVTQEPSLEKDEVIEYTEKTS